MTPEQLLILAVVQGLTEFLPVSSSGHLNLIHLLSDLPDEGPVIDVALHVGSLVAVLVYFHHDTVRLMRGARDALLARPTGDARLVWWLAAASVPLALAGFAMLATGLVDAVRSLEVIAWTTVLFALVLWACDRLGPVVKTMERARLPDAVVLGLAQMLALVPGVSRSGIVMSAARGLGFERTEAARLAMLMAIPAILMSGLGTALQTGITADPRLLADAALAAGAAFVAAFVSIVFMMALLRRVSMMPFVVYRLALGMVLMWFAYA